MTLPTPASAFDWTPESWGAALRCRPLAALAQHAFTTRQLQLQRGPEAQPGEWAAVADSVGVGLDRIVRVKQVHGCAVRVVREETAHVEASHERPEADAIVSDVAGLALTVLVADCVPVLLVDPQRGAAAAIHAGWRGTCAGVARAAVSTMVRQLGSRPDQLLAAIGPSIRPCCYEVGEELVDAFRAGGHTERDIARWFTRAPAERDTTSLRLDVARANRDQLVGAGLDEARIFDCGFCTKTLRQTFDSYRADGAAAGRIAAIVVVPGRPRAFGAR